MWHEHLKDGGNRVTNWFASEAASEMLITRSQKFRHGFPIAGVRVCHEVAQVIG
jgi:hypothetical protein